MGVNMYKEYMTYELENGDGGILIIDNNGNRYKGRNVNEELLIAENKYKFLKGLQEEFKQLINSANNPSIKAYFDLDKIFEKELEKVEDIFHYYYAYSSPSDLTYIVKFNESKPIVKTYDKYDLYKPTIKALTKLRDEIFEKYGYMIYYGKTEDELAKTFKK